MCVLVHLMFEMEGILVIGHVQMLYSLPHMLHYTYSEETHMQSDMHILFCWELPEHYIIL